MGCRIWKIQGLESRLARDRVDRWGPSHSSPPIFQSWLATAQDSVDERNQTPKHSSNRCLEIILPHWKHLGWKMSFLLGRPPTRCYVSFWECNFEIWGNGGMVIMRLPAGWINLSIYSSYLAHQKLYWSIAWGRKPAYMKATSNDSHSWKEKNITPPKFKHNPWKVTETQ